MAGGKSVILRVVMAVVAVVAVLLVSAVFMVFKRPLTVDAWMSRRGLSHAGLSRTTVTAPFGKVGVWESGSGPVLVLLHGAGDQAGAWARVAPQLVSRYRVLAVDLPGHGGSDPTSGPLGVGTVLEGVEAVITAKAPDAKVTIAGNSLGAWIALLYGERHPERVERLVLVNGGATEHRAEGGLTLMPENRQEAGKLMDALTGPATPPVPGFVLDDVVRAAHHGPIARLFATAGEMPKWVLDGRLDQVRVPVDMVWGDADELMPITYAQEMAQELPAARVTPVHGCGHVPERECPDRFLKAFDAAMALPPPAPAAASLEEP